MLGGTLVHAQHSFWVFFTDKDGVEFDPEAYFHEAALERRDKHKVPRDHISDYPVREDYVDIVCNMVNECGYASRWFNALFVTADELQIEAVRQLSFVRDIEISRVKLDVAQFEMPDDDMRPISTPDYLHQIRSMNGQEFGDHEYTGKNVRIAVFDAGFPEVTTHFSLYHIKEAKRIAATFNFARPKKDVFRSNAHGLMVLSNIAGKNQSKQLMGLAPDATFLLALTEIRREIFKEEQWWLAAAEWADKNGAQIINSSLGYTDARYFPEQMDGRTALVTRAANMAAGKGILVVNAAGNEGTDESWTYIGAPADADSVLTVGGIDPNTNFKIGFSSIGPTRSGTAKPNVVAHGQTLVAKKGNTIDVAYGTSFATPLVSGFAACLMQAFPDLTNMEIMKKIEQSGSLYPFFDYAHGYGIPQAHLALFDSLTDNIQPTFSVDSLEETLPNISIHPEVFQHQRTLDPLAHNHFYISYEDKKGELIDHYLMEIVEPKFTINFVPDNTKFINFHFKGYSVRMSFDPNREPQKYKSEEDEDEEVEDQTEQAEEESGEEESSEVEQDKF
jgi:serine protease AprX